MEFIWTDEIEVPIVLLEKYNIDTKTKVVVVYARLHCPEEIRPSSAHV